MSKKHQYEKDTINDFMNYLKERDITLVKNIIPKYYERTNYKGEGERTLVNFTLELKKVSDKDIERELRLFIIENFEL